MKKFLLLFFGFTTLFTFGQCPESVTDTLEACEGFTWTDGISYSSANYVPITTIGAQTPALFSQGPNTTWTNVYTACVVGDGNNGAQQTLVINIIELPAGGANYRVIKTVANGNFFNGNPQPLALGLNTINVAAPGNPWGDRTVKFQFGSADIKFSTLALNGAPVYEGTTQTLTNAAGCDSLVTLDLTFVDNSTSSTEVVSACDSYTWIDGNSYTESVFPVANTNHLVETVGMTFSPSSLNVFVGDTVTFMNTGGNHNVNGTTGTFSGNPESFGNAVGSGWTFTHVFGTAGTYDYQCDPHAPMMAGVITVSEINNVTHVIPNTAGCDSTITLNLTISNSSTSTDAITSCDAYTWIDGIEYTESNDTAIFVLPNATGCDSTVRLDLTISSVNAGVNVVDELTLQAQADEDATYQWLDCSDNYAPIAGETNATFTTETSGDYAVEVSIDGCTDTSDCYTITSTVNIDDLNAQYGIQLFPNPTTNDLTISLDGIDVVDMVLVDIQGKVLMQKTGLFNQDRISLSAYAAGTYFVRIMTPEGSREIRITKQ